MVYDVITTGQAVDTTLGSTATAAKIIREAFGEWTGTVRDQTALTERLRGYADKNKAFGFNEDLLLEEYPEAPILYALRNSKVTSGSVSVAFVPSGLGKTTAAMRVLQKHGNRFRGISICAGNLQDGEPYVTRILELLRIDQRNPPKGWMGCLFKALKAHNDERQPLLILDEVNCPPQREHPDCQLITAIKNRVKNTGIHVVVLTPDKECAEFLSGLNQLVAIGPMLHVYSSPNDFPKGGWLGMQFSVSMLRVACMNNPVLLKRAKKREEIGAKFDALVQTNVDGYLENKKPQFVIDELLLAIYNEENAALDLALSTSTIRDTTVNDPKGCWATFQESCTVS